MDIKPMILVSVTREDPKKRAVYRKNLAFNISDKNITTYGHCFNITLTTAPKRLGNRQLVIRHAEFYTRNKRGIYSKSQTQTRCMLNIEQSDSF